MSIAKGQLSADTQCSHSDDIGNFFGDYVTGDKAFKGEENKPTVTLEWADLRGVLATLTNNVDDLNAALELLEQLAK